MTDTEKQLHESLIGCMDVAQCRATVTTLEALAEAAGIKELHGKSVRDFFAAVARRETEAAISDIADDSPELATLVKQRWDYLDGLDAAKEGL